MADFVHQRSIVRAIWGNSDLILLIFAGSAAEFALNRAVDWLFFTNRIPQDPIGRLFSTARFAQEIAFADEATAMRTLDRITAIHQAVERERGSRIPDWAYRDVLFMLIDYSERAHHLLYRQLTRPEKRDLYDVFHRIGDRLHISELPPSYEEYRLDRQLHLERDLVYSQYTERLYEQYRHHLGCWRYELLLQVQAALVPERVRRLLKMEQMPLLREMIGLYGIFGALGLRSIVQSLLLPTDYLNEMGQFDRLKSESP
jgi:ER-bound oxygenase mpaB/B'/Rubber oxygenase, catalytic domain